MGQMGYAIQACLIKEYVKPSYHMRIDIVRWCIAQDLEAHTHAFSSYLYHQESSSNKCVIFDSISESSLVCASQEMFITVFKRIIL